MTDYNRIAMLEQQLDSAHRALALITERAPGTTQSYTYDRVACAQIAAMAIEEVAEVAQLWA